MGKCVKCGTNFVGTAANPPPDALCRYCEIDELRIALRESVKLQSFYAEQLNVYDGGKRMPFKDSAAWIARLKVTGAIN